MPSITAPPTRFGLATCSISGGVPFAAVVVGTDYPFDMGSYDVHSLVGSVPGLSAAEREAILEGNATRLLGLGSWSRRKPLT